MNRVRSKNRNSRNTRPAVRDDRTFESPVQDAIVWLHLSDLHFCEPETGWAAHEVLEGLINDLRSMEAAFGLSPQMVFFTGDAALGQLGHDDGRSLEEQFDKAHELLERIRTTFSHEIPRENVFIVPGNHDVDRTQVTRQDTEWLDSQNGYGGVTDLIQTGGKEWLRFMERLAEYNGFLRRHGYEHLLTRPSHLIYGSKLKINGINIGIAGLNSAWSCGRKREKGLLWLGGKWQIAELKKDLVGVDFKIALLHHPLGWFVPQDDGPLRSEIQREFQFLLHGHEHLDWIEANEDGHVRIGGAAVFEGHTEEHGYNIVRLDLRTAEISVWLRRYKSADGGWVQRVVREKTDKDGKWPISSVGWLRKRLRMRPDISADNDSGTDQYLRQMTNPIALLQRLIQEITDPHLFGHALHRFSRIHRNLGKFSEAIEPLQQSLDIALLKKDFGSSAVRARHLSETHLLCGNIREAVRVAQKAVKLADKSKSHREMVIERAICGNALSQFGKRSEALKRFREAESRLQRFEPGQRFLYSLWGYMYLDTLLDADPAAVVERARRILSSRRRGTLISLNSLDKPIIQVILGTARLRTIRTGKTQRKSICKDLQKALRGLRKAEYQDDLVRGLLAYAEALGRCRNMRGARKTIDEAIRIATPGRMLLQMADIRLLEARLFHDRNSLAAAGDLIEKCRYARRMPEFKRIQAEAKEWGSKPKKGHAHLPLRLFLVRHGTAEAASSRYGDESRPLTSDGREEAKAVSLHLAKLAPNCKLVWTSPYKRSRQTAEAIAKSFSKCEVAAHSFLRPDEEPSQAASAIKRNVGKVDVICVVGHQPHIGRLVETLCQTAGTKFEIQPASILEIQIAFSHPGSDDVRSILCAVTQVKHL